MREYSSREIPEGFLDSGVAAFFGWAGAGVEELGKERILRTSAADAPAILHHRRCRCRGTGLSVPVRSDRRPSTVEHGPHISLEIQCHAMPPCQCQ